MSGTPLKVRCRAKKRNGDQCTQWAVRGALVCRMHGGSAPHVIENARRRMGDAEDLVHARVLELAKPAIDRLAAIMSGQVEDVEVKASDMIRAAERILDQAGYQITKRSEIELHAQRAEADLDKEIEEELGYLPTGTDGETEDDT